MAGVSEGRKAVEMSQSAGFESSGGAIAMAATGNLITMRQRGRDFTCWNPPLLGRRRANTNETSGRFGGNETCRASGGLVRQRQYSHANGRVPVIGGTQNVMQAIVARWRSRRLQPCAGDRTSDGGDNREGIRVRVFLKKKLQFYH
ncbi:hypothetical protein GW17_00058826 [Ensete ventricosum]|nr:hypothetical protein GW17_00058826 [Ensete ventricosum]